jgi:predicted DCC family thiol-disulfide oxidoreductase YuxK
MLLAYDSLHMANEGSRCTRDMTSPTTAVRVDAAASAAAPNWDVEVFYDGECPLCRREVAWLKRRDKAQRIRFTNIAEAGFSAEALGTTTQRLMSQMHGRLSDGTWIKGVEVFRRMYAAAGHTWLVALSRLPILAQLLDLGYRVFARHRLRLTGRCGPDAATCRKNPSG